MEEIFIQAKVVCYTCGKSSKVELPLELGNVNTVEFSSRVLPEGWVLSSAYDYYSRKEHIYCPRCIPK